MYMVGEYFSGRRPLLWAYLCTHATTAIYTPTRQKNRAVKGLHPLQRAISGIFELREQDLNLRPSGYEPDELPGCSIPRFYQVTT